MYIYILYIYVHILCLYIYYVFFLKCRNIYYRLKDIYMYKTVKKRKNIFKIFRLVAFVCYLYKTLFILLLYSTVKTSPKK